MQNNNTTIAENMQTYIKFQLWSHLLYNAYNRTIFVTDNVYVFVCDAGIWITGSS
jgi:hypothetical protein